MCFLLLKNENQKPSLLMYVIDYKEDIQNADVIYKDTLSTGSIYEICTYEICSNN